MKEMKILIIGEVGSGKSCIAHLVEKELREKGIAAVVWEGGEAERNLRGPKVLEDLSPLSNTKVTIDEVNPQQYHSEERWRGFQSRVGCWLVDCFGEKIAENYTERQHRFLEEALELVQSTGTTKEEAMQLVEYVYSRPEGEVEQEIGGVMVTLAALCFALRSSMYSCGRKELERISQPEVMERIREKQKTKPAVGPLPGCYPERKPLDVEVEVELELCEDEGCPHHGSAHVCIEQTAINAMERLTQETKLFRDLLSVIHGDGGHYQARYGSEQAAADAVAKVHELRTVVDEQQADNGALQQQLLDLALAVPALVAVCEKVEGAPEIFKQAAIARAKSLLGL